MKNKRAKQFRKLSQRGRFLDNRKYKFYKNWWKSLTKPLKERFGPQIDKLVDYVNTQK